MSKQYDAQHPTEAAANAWTEVWRDIRKQIDDEASELVDQELLETVEVA